MSNMIQEVVIQARGNSNTWNSAVNYAFNSLSLYAGIDRAAMGWNMQQARSRLHEAMDDVQSMLDGIGTIPIFGEVADGMNGLISLRRGNRGQAALSFAAMVPIVGWGATAMKIAKPEIKAFEHSFEYADRVRMRALEDPISHNFPYSFDDLILGTKGIEKSNGYQIFQLEGTMNGKVGVYEIGLTKTGIIDHRFFRPTR